MATAQQDRRGMILEHAAELFARKGISATTVREIADAVGILSGSLYHHFKSKDEMVDAIMSPYLADLLHRFTAVVEAEPDPRRRLDLLIHVSFEAAFAKPHQTEIYQHNVPLLLAGPSQQMVRDTARRIQTTWIETIEAGVGNGSFRTDVEPTVFYRLLRDALWLSVRWYRPGGAYTVAKLADDCTKIFLEGFSVSR